MGPRVPDYCASLRSRIPPWPPVTLYWFPVASFPVQGILSIIAMDLESKYCYFYHSWDFVPYKYHIEKIQVLQTPDNSCHKLCLETKVEYLILNQDLVFYNTGIRNNAHHLLVSHTWKNTLLHYHYGKLPLQTVITNQIYLDFSIWFTLKHVLSWLVWNNIFTYWDPSNPQLVFLLALNLSNWRRQKY